MVKKKLVEQNKSLFMKIMENSVVAREFNAFLAIYKNVPLLRFAVIVVSRETLCEHVGIIAEQIAQMNKLGIYPVVFVGSVSLQKAPRGMVRKEVSNFRVDYEQASRQLRNSIISNGGDAVVVDDVFHCRRDMRFDDNQDIRFVNVPRLEDIVQKSCTPIIYAMGKLHVPHMRRKKSVCVSDDDAVKELMLSISPRKVIFLNDIGGVMDEHNAVIPFLNLFSKKGLRNIPEVSYAMIEELKEYLRKRHECAVTITAPENILNEVFTVKGSGTYIRYHSIRSVKSAKNLDQGKLTQLLEDSFGKKLARNYLKSNGFVEIFHEANYMGVAIIKKVKSIHYLDKFAVARESQGTGLGQSLWNKVVDRYKKLIWRANPSNPINSFYVKYCDGMIKSKNWNIYWKNLAEKEIIETVRVVKGRVRTLIDSW